MILKGIVHGYGKWLFEQKEPSGMFLGILIRAMTSQNEISQTVAFNLHSHVQQRLVQFKTVYSGKLYIRWDGFRPVNDLHRFKSV